MKKLFTLFIVVNIVITAFAQVPQKMSYQSVLRNSNGELITSQDVVLKISILQGSEGGTEVYSEVQTTATNINGLVSIEVGAGTTAGDFSSIEWGNGPYYIKVEADPEGGTNYTIAGTSQLLSVPYALFAGNSGSSISEHYIGELYGGGIIFWLTPDKEHGLIASLKDLDNGDGCVWSNVTDAIGETAQNATDGVSNTNAIIAQTGHTSSAAQLCKDYTSDDYSGWYLPSTREFVLLSSVDYLIDYILDNDDDDTTVGFSQEYDSFFGRYWTSVETPSGKVWAFKFSEDLLGSAAKTSAYRVRAIRAF